MNDHLTRAFYAYFKHCFHSSGVTVFPSTEHSGIESFNTKIYVTLRNDVGAPIVIYRVRANGYLRQVCLERLLRSAPNMIQPPRPDGRLFKRLHAVPAHKIT